jgi:hypothetical protein
MKLTILAMALLAFTTAFGQVKVTQGNNSPDFNLNKQSSFTSFSTSDADYFVIRRVENFEKINTLVVADKNGSITTSKEVRVNMGVFNNSSDVQNLLVVGKNAVVFVENHNKADGKNTLTARVVDKNGNVEPTGVTIGSIDFTKMTNPGDWYTCLTPDKKHVAVIAKTAYEKNIPEQFKYFILDDQLKETSKGNFSFAGNTKKIEVFSFLASDKGDFYLMSEEYDKSYKFPVLYKYTAGAQAMIIPVMIADPDLKNMSYTSKVNPAGDLIIAGYTQRRQTFTTGDTKSVGTWIFNSLKPNEVKTFKLETPATNLTARDIVYNGDTFYLVGEQYKAEKERNTANALARISTTEVFTYTHNDIMITGFTNDCNKKFEMALSRRWESRDFDSDLTVATGIINNKLAVVYNDQYGKYIEDKAYYRDVKLPVAVLVTNDGLMESPVHFAKDLDVKVSTYKLYPQFYSNSDGRLVLLSGNSQSVKTITFK